MNSYTEKLIAALFSSLLLCSCTKIEEKTIPVIAETNTDSAVSSEIVTENTTTSSTSTTSATTSASLSETSTSLEETSVLHETMQENKQTDISVNKIKLSIYDVTIKVGSSKMPIVTMLPNNATDKSEIWTSSDINIATVDKLGNITGVSEGTCKVYVAAAVDPEIIAEVNVEVVPADEGITYIDGILVVNKTYSIPSDYNPGVDQEAKDAFDKMQAAAYSEGLNIYISSGFRSYEYQSGLYERYAARDGYTEADRYSARPGHSEHQTGLAFDLNTIDDSFADTAEGKWVAEHCAEYGFIIRYPKDKEAITGFIYEPWHIRYLGEETAKKVYNSGMCLEEYLGIDSVYSD